MKYDALHALFVCALLLCVAPLFAASHETVALAKDPVTGLTAAKAVLLGHNKFEVLYERKTQNKSTAGMCRAAYTYANLRRYINDRAVVKRTEAQQEMIKHVRKCCINIAISYTKVHEARREPMNNADDETFPTEYALCSVEVETSIGKVILSMEQPTPNPQGRRASDEFFTSLLDDPNLSLSDRAWESISTKKWKEQYHSALTRLNAELPRLHHLAKSLPDNGRTALAGFAKYASSSIDLQWGM